MNSLMGLMILFKMKKKICNDLFWPFLYYLYILSPTKYLFSLIINFELRLLKFRKQQQQQKFNAQRACNLVQNFIHVNRNSIELFQLYYVLDTQIILFYVALKSLFRSLFCLVSHMLLHYHQLIFFSFSLYFHFSIHS